ncbi:hypothetical protein [Vibrio ruber]|nr:hypothetical protein [Vibrio ruber]
MLSISIQFGMVCYPFNFTRTTMQWFKKFILIVAIITASIYMLSVGVLTYLFSSADDEPQGQEQISEQASVSEVVTANDQLWLDEGQVTFRS